MGAENTWYDSIQSINPFFKSTTVCIVIPMILCYYDMLLRNPPRENLCFIIQPIFIIQPMSEYISWASG